ncbi:MAG: T9SS type A sorting domain-containing protein [Chitinophagaceae bacterium]
MQVGSGNEYQYHRAWIDYNNDGTFSASEEVMKTGTFYGNYSLQTDSFTVPYTGVVFNTPLRLRVSADVTTSFTPCSLLIGQAEDYSVIVHRDTASGSPSVSAENGIRVFPNPVADELRILSPQPLDLFLYNLEGRLVMQAHAQTTLQVGSLPNGFYLLRIADAHTGATIRYHKLQKWSN